MYHGYVWSDILHFIGLQVSDKVPLDVFGEVIVFTAKLLYMAFAEDALSGSVCFRDGIWTRLPTGHRREARP